MRKVLVFALVGLGAQLVDGALGMGYGVTSTSLLLLAGISPVTASASVHLAEVGTTLASGAAHWRFGNVDWRLVGRLGVPGAVGAFLGATALASVSTDVARPWTAGILLLLGVYILARFLRPRRRHAAGGAPHGRRLLVPLGLTAGFVDASGGGGWGPLSTSTLLSAGRTAPRQVIGSVSASEFLVSVAASAGFLVGLGADGLLGVAVLGLLAGGVLAAPVAAWLVRHARAEVLGTLVGGGIVATNLGTVLGAAGVTGTPRLAAYGVVLTGWAALVTAAARRAPAADATAGAGAGSTAGTDAGSDTSTDTGAPAAHVPAAAGTVSSGPAEPR